MNILAHSLPWVQISLAVLLTLAILVQQSAAGIGSLGGGSDTGGIRHTRRGFEKFVFYLTIVVAILFALSAFAAILLK